MSVKRLACLPLGLALALGPARAHAEPELTDDDQIPADALPELVTLRQPTEPVPEAEALALVEALQAELTAGTLDPARLSAFLQPMDLPSQPGIGWYQAYTEALQPGEPLAAHLAQSQGVMAVLPGPDYTRVLFDGQPVLSAVLYKRDGVAWIDSLAVTTCTLCSEPARFARDLLAQVTARGTTRGRLLPGVELYVGSPPVPTEPHWHALLQARNESGGELDRLLRGASVQGTSGEQLRIAYADGTPDLWTVRYQLGRWQLDYAALPAESPLRLEGAGLGQWRDSAVLAASAVQTWQPSFELSPEQAGLCIGHAAIGAHFSPLGEDVLVVVADMDRVAAALYRVDPVSRLVLSRRPLPSPDPRSHVQLGTWFGHWPSWLSDDGEQLVITLPKRQYSVPLSGAPPLLTLLPTPEPADPEQPQLGPNRGWAAAASKRGLSLTEADGDRAVTVGQGRVLSLAWSADGQALLTHHANGEVWWWDVSRLQQLAR